MIKDFLFVGAQFLLMAAIAIETSITNIVFGGHLNLGSLFLAIGFLIALTAVIQLNINLSPFPTPKKESTLISKGIYGYLRHPIYTGIILMGLGCSIFTGNLDNLIFTILLGVLFYYKSTYEERLLSKKFPEYSKYKESTWKIFPFDTYWLKSKGAESTK